MCGSDHAPVLRLPGPGSRGAIGHTDPALNTDRCRVASHRPRIATHPLNRGPSSSIRWKLRKPAIAQTSNALDHRLDPWSTTAEPHGNGTLDRQRVESRVADVVPASMEIDHVLGPQSPQHGKLFFRAFATIMEILAERFVLHV